MVMLEMVGNYAHLFVVCQLKLVCSKFPLRKYFDFLAITYSRPSYYSFVEIWLFNVVMIISLY